MYVLYPIFLAFPTYKEKQYFLILFLYLALHVEFVHNLKADIKPLFKWMANFLSTSFE